MWSMIERKTKKKKKKKTKKRATVNCFPCTNIKMERLRKREAGYPFEVSLSCVLLQILIIIKIRPTLIFFSRLSGFFFFFSFVEKGKELINHWVVTRERYYKKRKKNRRNDIAAAKVKKKNLAGCVRGTGKTRIFLPPPIIKYRAN